MSMDYNREGYRSRVSDQPRGYKKQTRGDYRRVSREYRGRKSAYSCADEKETLTEAIARIATLRAGRVPIDFRPRVNKHSGKACWSVFLPPLNKHAFNSMIEESLSCRLLSFQPNQLHIDTERTAFQAFDDIMEHKVTDDTGRDNMLRLLRFLRFQNGLNKASRKKFKEKLEVGKIMDKIESRGLEKPVSKKLNYMQSTPAEVWDYSCISIKITGIGQLLEDNGSDNTPQL